MRRMKAVLALLLTCLTLTALLPQRAAALSNEAVIYQFLRGEMGLSEAAACGVLANIQCESDFDPGCVGDNGTSYGICQWHNSRWTRLRQYRPGDWNTLRGQLEFLRYELIQDKSSVWRYIRAVSNDAEGAYLAGHYWCYHFEIPKNYPAVSVRRGNLARSTYWPRYMGVGTGEGAVPSFAGVTCPDALAQGEACQLYGSIYSDTPLSRLTVTLTDPEGRLAAEQVSLSPYTTTYTIHTLSRYIPFQTLAPGQYTLTLTAANSSGSADWQQALIIRPARSSPQTAGPSPLRQLLERSSLCDLTPQGQSRLSLITGEALAQVLRLRD